MYAIQTSRGLISDVTPLQGNSNGFQLPKQRKRGETDWLLDDFENGEADLANRAISSISYLLPLLDGLHYSKYILLQVPQFVLVLLPLAPVIEIFEEFRWLQVRSPEVPQLGSCHSACVTGGEGVTRRKDGQEEIAGGAGRGREQCPTFLTVKPRILRQIVAFFGLALGVANNRSLPKFTRFNAQQAILLDIIQVHRFGNLLTILRSPPFLPCHALLLPLWLVRPSPQIPGESSAGLAEAISIRGHAAPPSPPSWCLPPSHQPPCCPLAAAQILPELLIGNKGPPPGNDFLLEATLVASNTVFIYIYLCCVSGVRLLLPGIPRVCLLLSIGERAATKGDKAWESESTGLRRSRNPVGAFVCWMSPSHCYHNMICLAGRVLVGREGHPPAPSWRGSRVSG